MEEINKTTLSSAIAALTKELAENSVGVMLSRPQRKALAEYIKSLEARVVADWPQVETWIHKES